MILPHLPLVFHWEHDSLGGYIDATLLHGRRILAGPFVPPEHHLVIVRRRR